MKKLIIVAACIALSGCAALQSDYTKVQNFTIGDAAAASQLAATVELYASARRSVAGGKDDSMARKGKLWGPGTGRRELSAYCLRVRLRAVPVPVHVAVAIG